MRRVPPKGVQQRDELGILVGVEPSELGPAACSRRWFVDGVERVHLTPRSMWA
jgi:hypothetical protein